MPGGVGEPDETLPYVTVVMPVRNEARSVSASLTAILGQDYPAHRLEVIVADGMSDDGTRDVIEAAVRASGTGTPFVTVIDNHGRISATGLNAAIAKARGDVIVRVDGHCEVEHDYVTTCVRLLEETGAENVGGVTIAHGTSVLQRAIAHGMTSPFGVGNAHFRYATKPGWVDTVFPGAWRREVFERFGNFDDELVRNQDDEHNLRITQSGGRIWLDPRLRVRYEPRDSLGALSRQYYEYGFYKVRVIQKRRRLGSLRHIIPGAFVATLVVGTVAALLTRRRRILIPLVVPYAGASIVASARSARSDSATLPVLPIVFATLHLSYGVGFLAGLWSWRRG